MRKLACESLPWIHYRRPGLYDVDNLWWLCLEAGIFSLVDTPRCTSHSKTLPYNPSRYRERLCPGPQVSPVTSDTGTCTTESVLEAYRRGGVLRTISTRPTLVHTNGITITRVVMRHHIHFTVAVLTVF